MKEIIFTLFAIHFFISQLSAQCVNDTNNIVSFSFNQNLYEIVKENKSWTDANSCAKSRGGHLAIIDSLKEQDTIFSSLNKAGILNSNTQAPDGGNAAYVWIGGTDSATEGTWVWDTIGANNPQFWSGARNGSPVGGRYNNWGNEPDNFQNQDGLGLALSSWPFGVAGEWNDIDQSNSLYYVIEYQVPVGIQKPDLKTKPQAVEMNLYPNPASDWVSLNCDCKLKPNTAVFIYDHKGAIVIKTSVDGSLNQINLQSLKAGVYWVRVEGIKRLAPLQKLE